MKKKIVSFLVCVGFVVSVMAQNLQSFTVNLSADKDGNSYLGIANKKTYNSSDAKTHRSSVDLALLRSNNYGSPVLEWYNMSGKDEMNIL